MQTIIPKTRAGGDNPEPWAGNRRRQKWRGTAAAVVLLTGILASVALFVTLRGKEREAAENDFRDAVHNEVSAFHRTVDSWFLALESVQAFYAGSQSVERSEFREFVAPFLRRHPSLRSLQWIPCVRDFKRAGHEAGAVKDGCAGYEITDWDGERVRLKAARRHVYFPVYYAEPAKANRLFLGVDLGTSAAFRELAQRAGDSGKALLTSATILERDAVDQAIVQFIAPIYRNGDPVSTVDERRKNLQGFVLAAVAASDLVEEGRAALTPAGLDVYLASRSASGGERLLSRRLSRMRDPAGPASAPEQWDRSSPLHETADLDLPGEDWSVTYAAAPAFIEANTTWEPWAGLACGLLLTVLVGAYVAGTAFHNARTERLATRLAKTNHELESEIIDRKEAELAFQTSQAKYRTLYDSSRDAIMLATPEEGFFAGNPAAITLFGCKDEGEFISYSPADLSPEHQPDGTSSSEKAQEMMAIAMREGSHFFEWTHKRANGDEFFATVLLTRTQVEGKMVLQATVRDITDRRQAEARQARLLRRVERINELQDELILPGPLEEKVKKIADAAVDLLDLDFCRIWIMKPADLCDRGCIHAAATEERYACRRRDNCLHLMASSGRYTRTDGSHRRVPIGCYRIGCIASEEEKKFLTNGVSTDPGVHDHEWAKSLGLVSFAGYRLRDANGDPIGVLAMFAKHAISEEDDAFLSNLAETTSRVVLTNQATE